VNNLATSLRFHPITVLGISLGGALVYTVWALNRFSGAGLRSQLFYVVPIVVPFIAFLFDRAGELGEARPIAFVIDALVVGLAMMRVVSTLPFISGHALFLVYAIFRPGSLVTRISAAVVMLEVVYLKFFVWHDFVTPVTGTALGLTTALIVQRLNNTEQRGGKFSIE